MTILRCAALLSVITISGCVAETYESYKTSNPPFFFIKKDFLCQKPQEQIKWASILIDASSRNRSTSKCGAVILAHQYPDLWRELDECLNNKAESSEQCSHTEEQGVAYRFDIPHLESDKNIPYSCSRRRESPQISAIHIEYTCTEKPPHMDLDDIITGRPRVPSLLTHDTFLSDSTESDNGTQPHSSMNTSKETLNSAIPSEVQQSTSEPEAAEVTTNHTSKDVSTFINVSTTFILANSDLKSSTEALLSTEKVALPSDKDKSDEKNTVGRNLGITSKELAVIVGPSIGAVILVMVISVSIFVCYKKRINLIKRDVQGQNLFDSRRSSSASVLSDISVNSYPIRLSA